MAAEIGTLESTDSGELLSQTAVAELILSAIDLSQTYSLVEVFHNRARAEWQYFDTAVALGFFGRNANAPAHNWTNGRNIEIRRVRHRNDDAGGPFDIRVVLDPSSENGEREVYQHTACQGEWDNPNVFALEGPIKYLQQWINWNTLPGREVGFPYDPAPMSFEGEFYEIVNTQQDRRG